MSYERKVKGYENDNILKLSALTKQQCEKIISTAAEILEEKGVRILHGGVKQRLENAECIVKLRTRT